ncbi:hypothetical protein SCALIN_C09_0001 [Candidatus Scalindua japonica]|uniref:Uncharacterized protein n=1 Tax=Candidatus Scalindua japonica TaxID=1284222 RepID=A0A286TWH0_9BACT|nr:hypothetical protein SCALIN_C09_0001 [Candidatus Scalindua japonica]
MWKQRDDVDYSDIIAKVEKIKRVAFSPSVPDAKVGWSVCFEKKEPVVNV